MEIKLPIPKYRGSTFHDRKASRIRERYLADQEPDDPRRNCPAQELLADIGKRIAEEEAAVRQRLDRLSQYDDPYIEDQMRREWSQFHARIEPMRQEQEYVLKQLTQIEACKPPKTMIVTAEESDRMGLSCCDRPDKG